MLHTTDNWAPHEGYDPLDSCPDRLGQAGERPQSRREAEARFLIGIRTDWHMDRLEKRYGGSSSDWPREFRIEAQARERLLRACGGKIPGWRKEDYDDVHIDYSALNAIGRRWRPEPRDVSDWEQGVLNWGKDLSDHRWRILRARANNPPWGFPEIDYQESKHRGWSWRHYRWAIDQIWERARGDFG
jgi:hypothetical protein